MREFLIGVIIGLIFISTPAHGYGKFTGKATLKDGNRATVTLNTNVVPLFVFSPAMPQDILNIKVSQAIKVVLADFDTNTLRKDEFAFAYPLRETLDEMLKFYGYKTDELQIVSFEIGKCDGKVCRP